MWPAAKRACLWTVGYNQVGETLQGNCKLELRGGGRSAQAKQQQTWAHSGRISPMDCDQNIKMSDFLLKMSTNKPPTASHISENQLTFLLLKASYEL